MACKGCGNNTKLIKAHAIPESFFVGLREGDNPPRLITDTSGVYPKKAPIGVYDNGILCRECEDRFQDVDDYAQCLLLQKEDSHIELKNSNKVVGYQIDNVSYRLLKLSFISVLWRASISTHAFYSKVNIGSFEALAKNLIWNNNPGEPSQFSFIIAKFTDQEVGRTILDPHRERWGNVNYIRLYMYGYVVYIKVDKRPAPAILKPFEFNKDGTLFIVARDIHNSAEYPLLVSVANKAKI